MWRQTQGLFRELQSAFAPARCIACLRTDTWLCISCWSDLTRHSPSLLSCIGCGERATSQGLTCTECRSIMPLRGVVSAGSYQLPALQRGVRWLKFKGIREVAPALARLLLSRLLLIAPLEQLQHEAVFIPVPLHPRRERERGFNQSALLAWNLSQDTGIPVVDILLRHRSTWTQSHLPVDLRRSNIQNSFVLTSPLDEQHFSGRSIALLVDDVSTSGATIADAARGLTPLSFSQVWGVTVARG